jgi:hypothetical protein
MAPSHAETEDEASTVPLILQQKLDLLREKSHTASSELEIVEGYTGEDEQDRYVLRLWHPDTGVSHITERLTLEEMRGYLKGYLHGKKDEIDHLVTNHYEGHIRASTE